MECSINELEILMTSLESNTHLFPFLIRHSQFLLNAIFQCCKRFALLNANEKWCTENVKDVFVEMRYGNQHFIFHQIQFVSRYLFEAIDYLWVILITMLLQICQKMNAFALEWCRWASGLVDTHIPRVVLLAVLVRFCILEWWPCGAAVFHLRWIPPA